MINATYFTGEASCFQKSLLKSCSLCACACAAACPYELMSREYQQSLTPNQHGYSTSLCKDKSRTVTQGANALLNDDGDLYLITCHHSWCVQPLETAKDTGSRYLSLPLGQQKSGNTGAAESLCARFASAIADFRTPVNSP